MTQEPESYKGACILKRQWRWKSRGIEIGMKCASKGLQEKSPKKSEVREQLLKTQKQGS